MRIRTKIDDCDTDEHGDERAIPAGTAGTVQTDQFNGETTPIYWDNGAVTSWTPDELDRDAERLRDACLPDLAIVRTMELRQPPVADLPPADPHAFDLTAPDGRVEAIGKQSRFTF